MIIFHNAKIFSHQQPPPTAMVIDNGYFLALGSDEDILNGFPKADSIINLNGRTIWPGLTDAHVHLLHLAESMAKIDCETDSIDACLNRVEKAAKNLPEGAWILGHGWNQNRWDSGYGTAAQLDAVSQGHSAYLTAKSLHAAWANTNALALAGINRETPDPKKGIIQRDEKGELTGILFEGDAMALVESILPKPSEKERVEQIKSLIPRLLELGLVGVHDFDGMECWKALQTCRISGDLKFRVRKNIPFDHFENFIEAGLQTDFGDNWLHLGCLKLFADGALGPQTAAMKEPYENSTGSGTLLLDEKEIIEIGHNAIQNGIGLAVHAIGDLANHIVLNAFEKLRAFERAGGYAHFKHRIEHVQIIDHSDLPRLAELDIIASVQPVHAPSDMEISDRHLGDRAINAYPFKSILDTKATLVFGSDAPVEPVNPFIGIHAAVTRQRQDGYPGINGWHPYQRLSLLNSLISFSHTPAIVANRGSSLGKISPGYKADFIILKENPFELPPEQLHQTKPQATFVEGECRYTSEDYSLTDLN